MFMRTSILHVINESYSFAIPVSVYDLQLLTSRRRLLKSGRAMGCRRRSPGAEEMREGEHEKGVAPLVREDRGTFPEKCLRFRTSIDTFLLDFECGFGLEF